MHTEPHILIIYRMKCISTISRLWFGDSFWLQPKSLWLQPQAKMRVYTQLWFFLVGLCVGYVIRCGYVLGYSSCVYGYVVSLRLRQPLIFGCAKNYLQCWREWRVVHSVHRWPTARRWNESSSQFGATPPSPGGIWNREYRRKCRAPRWPLATRL